MPDFDLIDYLLSLLTQVIPHSWAVAAVVAFVAASAVTNFFSTPAKPQPGDSVPIWAKWLAYRLCELIAMVGKGAKQRPEVAAQVIVAAKALENRYARTGQLTKEDVQAITDVAYSLRR